MILRNADARIRWRWEPYFVPGEFACKHCGELQIETEFLDRLTELREAFDRPMVISSAFRCSDHNKAVSTTGAHGPHTSGSACDVSVSGEDAYDLERLAYIHGFTGLGRNQKGPHSGRFVHLDLLPAGGREHPRPRTWTY